MNRNKIVLPALAAGACLMLTACGSTGQAAAPAAPIAPRSVAQAAAVTVGTADTVDTADTAANAATPDQAIATPADPALQQQIESLLRDQGGSAHVCQDLMTPTFVTTFFGDQNACRSFGFSAEDAEAPFKVSAVNQTGDTATALLALDGGDLGDVTGTWTFSRIDGNWRISDWGGDFLRSMIAGEFGPNYEPGGSNDPMADPKTRSCVADGVRNLSDSDLRAVFVDSVHEKTNAALQQVIASCRPGATG
jgi:hypothetical protein